MSADNGIYIAKFPDGYRVCYAHAIDNVTYHREGTKARKKVLKAYFGKSKVFHTKANAVVHAHELEEEYLKGYGILEYGVSYIGEYESFE